MLVRRIPARTERWKSCATQNLSALPRDPAMAIPLVLLVVTLGCCQLARAADEYSV